MAWGLLTQSASTALPVSESELAEHLRIDVWSPGGELAALIRAATETVEATTGRRLIASRVLLLISGWPIGRLILLPHAPLSAVNGVSWRRRDGTIGSWTVSGDMLIDASGQYAARIEKDPPAIWLAPGRIWPSDPLDHGMPVQVDATYGYGSAAAVPQTLRHAILMLAAHWFEHRAAAGVERVTEVPMAIDYLLAPYRIHTSGYAPV